MLFLKHFSLKLDKSGFHWKLAMKDRASAEELSSLAMIMVFNGAEISIQYRRY